MKNENMDALAYLGYKIENGRYVRLGATIDLNAPGDYGADPVGDGTFKMVPSGDIVDYDERCRRLSPGTGTQKTPRT